MSHEPIKTATPAELGGDRGGTGAVAESAAAPNRFYSNTPPRAAQVVIYADGACEPINPGGWATWGWVALDADGNEIASGRGCVAHGRGATNNLAEYTAALEATAWAQANGCRGVLLRTDSRLVVEQTTGRWLTNAAHLRPLRDQLRARLAAIGGRIEWVPREANARADELSRLAYVEARSGVKT